MKIFAGPRGSGRTTALIGWAQQSPNRVMVVQHVASVPAGLTILTFDQVNSWANRKFLGPVEFGIDDYDQLLMSHLSMQHLAHRVRAMTFYSEDYINIPRWRIDPVSDLQAIEGLREMVKDLA